MLNNQHVLKKEVSVYRKLLCCAVLLTGFLIQGQAMALSKSYYLFSEVKGTVYLNGEPLPGAEVEQEYQWKDTKKSSRVTTDQNGRYQFPAVVEKSFLWSLLPHEPVVFQNIRIHYQGKSYKGWSQTKHNYDNNGELNGRPFKLRCELTDEPGPHPEIGSFGICTQEQ